MKEVEIRDQSVILRIIARSALVTGLVLGLVLIVSNDVDDPDDADPIGSRSSITGEEPPASQGRP